MAYPSSLDSFTTKVYGQTIEATHVNTLQTAIASIENKVGVTGSTVTDSIEYMLTNANSSNPGHTHSGTSLTGILESNITDGSLLARVADNENVTGAYTFSNAAGLKVTGGATSNSATANDLIIGGGGSADSGKEVATISFGNNTETYLSLGSRVSSSYSSYFAFGANKLLSLKGGLYVGSSYKTTLTTPMNGLGRVTVENPDTNDIAAAYLKNTNTNPTGGTVLKIDSSVTGTAGDGDYNFIEVKSDGYSNYLKIRGDGRSYINTDPADSISSGTDYYPLTIGNKDELESTDNMYSGLRLYSTATGSGTQLAFQDANNGTTANGKPNTITQTYSAGRLDIAFSNNATGDVPSSTNIFMPGRVISVEPIASAAATTFGESQWAVQGYRTANIHLGVSSFLDDSLNSGASSANFYPTSLSANQTTSGVATRVGIGTAQSTSSRSSVPEQKVYGNLEVRGRNFSDAEQGDNVWPHASGFQFLSDTGGPRRGMIVVTDTSTQPGGKSAESAAGGGIYFTHLSNQASNKEICESPAAIRGILTSSNQANSPSDGTFGYGSGDLVFYTRYGATDTYIRERLRLSNTGNIVASNAQKVWNSVSGGVTDAQSGSHGTQVQQSTTGPQPIVEVTYGPSLCLHGSGSSTIGSPYVEPSPNVAGGKLNSGTIELSNFYPPIKLYSSGTTPLAPGSATDNDLTGSEVRFGLISWADPWAGSWTLSGTETQIPKQAASIECMTVDQGLTTTLGTLGANAVQQDLGTEKWLGQGRSARLDFRLRNSVLVTTANFYNNTGAITAFRMYPATTQTFDTYALTDAVVSFGLRKTGYSGGFGLYLLNVTPSDDFGKLWVDSVGSLFYSRANTTNPNHGRVITGYVAEDSDKPSGTSVNRRGEGVILTKSHIYVEQGAGTGNWKRVALSSYT
jgi:hypothetical protein